MKKQIQHFNHSALSLIEHIGLLVIAIATVFAMSSEVINMLNSKAVMLTDLLLLFLYLEVVAMIQRYYTSGKLPVRFPLYIGIVALARYLILDMKAMDEWRMIAVTSSILLLALAILLIRYGHVRFPYLSDESAPGMDKSETTH
ncbi:phosphate-starvation-inducible E [Sulfuriferula sp. AH1]|uniref:phosphate-starvation-inducible protein PsiE n=1 Tax=Sulfuriferula sp. AH1 TaxID=1985873 RepID=UPI000B3B0ACE|nr:phosphate-starvation-inducible PsiE family protein [Sulfuriferula sp. AH1]ARU30821.1 phosphate-starvation-inducible E [Sulfuriferula sp. AH1]